MKRIINTLGDIAKVALLLGIIGTTLFAAGSVQAQDLYQIEQPITHEQTVKRLEIHRGWDVRLTQTPAGSSTRVVVTTACADYFEEGAEPQVMEVYKEWYTVVENKGMPHKTVVDIYTAQPIREIHVYPGARLTIRQWASDSTRLEIEADSAARLVVDSLVNPGTTSITATDATVDLRYMRTRLLHIYARKASTVTEGDVEWHRQWIHRGEQASTSIAATDSARHVYVETAKCYDRERKQLSLNLYINLDLAKPAWLEGNRHGSPYNTNHALGLNFNLVSNQMKIVHRLSWQFGLSVGARWMELDNVVKVEEDRLVLDASHGATPPRQDLYSWSVGVPLMLTFGLDKRSSYFLYASLTPTYTFSQRLATSTLGEDHRRSREHEKVEVLRPFNVRAAIGLGTTLRGVGRLEFHIDLLPTFRSSAGAPQTRMMGLSYTF